MGWQRVSPGIWKDTATGQTVRSVTMPGASQAAAGNTNRSAPTRPATDTQVGQTANTALNTGIGGQTGVTSAAQGTSLGAAGDLSSLLKDSIFGNITGQQQGASGLENAVFGQLTQGVDQQRTQDTEELKQKLADQGVPMGSDLYNNQLQQLNNRYDQIFANAHNQAVTQGTNASISGINALSGVTQANAAQLSPEQVFQLLTQKALGTKQNQIAQQNANTAGFAAHHKGSGGGGGSSNTPSAFG